MKNILIIFLFATVLNAQALELIYDGNIVYNGAELIKNVEDKGFELGIELIGNTDFASDTWWSKGSGVTITGGVAQFTNVAQYMGLTKSSLCTVGKKYKTKYQIINYTSNNCLLGIGGSNGSSRTANGTYIQDLIATSNGNLSIYVGSGGNSGTWQIDNVSTRLTNLWANTGNHSIDTSSSYKQSGSLSGKLVATGAGNGTTNTISLASTLFTAVTSGLNYRFRVYAYTTTVNTTLTFKLGDIVLTKDIPISGMNVLNFNFKATASSTGNIYLYVNKASTVYLDEVSLKSGR